MTFSQKKADLSTDLYRFMQLFKIKTKFFFKYSVYIFKSFSFYFQYHQCKFLTKFIKKMFSKATGNS